MQEGILSVPTRRVTLIGCGALGAILAARLLASGVSLQILQRPGQRLIQLQREGVVITQDQDGARHQFMPDRVSAIPNDLQPADLVVVLVKAYATSDLGDLAQLIRPGGALLTLQNGLGNAEQLQDQVQAAQLLVGTTTYGAYRDHHGAVNWAGEGSIVFGPWRPEAKLSAQLTQSLLSESGLSVELLSDPRPALWQKLAVNLLTNPLTALIGCRNGQLLVQPKLVTCMQQLLEEFLVIAQRAGVTTGTSPFTQEELWALECGVLQVTAENRSSMLQDCAAQRPTEIDAVTGALLGYAQDDREFPLIRMLDALVRGREEIDDKPIERSAV